MTTIRGRGDWLAHPPRQPINHNTTPNPPPHNALPTPMGGTGKPPLNHTNPQQSA